MLRQVPGVEDVRGLNVRTRQIMAGINEGFPKWMSLFSNQDTINYAVNELVTLEYVDVGCQIWPMLVYLADHKADTLNRVVAALEQFQAAKKALDEAGIEIPGRLKVIGFDDRNLASIWPIPFTSFTAPFEEMGRASAALLLSMIEGKEHDSGTIHIKSSLVPRLSTGH